MNIEDLEIRTAEEAYLRGWMMGVNERIERIERIVLSLVDTPETHRFSHHVHTDLHAKPTKKPALVLIQGGKQLK